MDEYATVDDMIEKFKVLSKNGYGDLIVTCNDEYVLARKDEYPNEKGKYVDFGGHDLI